VNKAHLEFCSSPQWGRLVEDELLPWVLDGYELGEDLHAAGFARAHVHQSGDRLRFSATSGR